MRRSTLYALKKDGELRNFHPSRDYVAYMSSNTECDGKIYKLDVEETSEEKRTHYSYWDYEWERFSFTHELLAGIRINFPYAFDGNRSNKSGIILPVIITERSVANVRT